MQESRTRKARTVGVIECHGLRRHYLLPVKRHLPEHSPETTPCAGVGFSKENMELSPKLRVLVIDGMPLTRFGLASLIGVHPRLTVCGEAADGPSARAACAEHRPDFIILDLAVPRGGLGLLSDLRRLHPPGRVLVLSAEEDAPSVHRAFRAGARGYVSKGEEPGEVLAGLECLLQDRLFTSRRVQGALLMHLASGSSQGLDVQLSALSDREMQVFRLIGRSMGATAIGVELGVSVKTVETHQKRMKEKLGLASGERLRERAKVWVERTAERLRTKRVSRLDFQSGAKGARRRGAQNATA